MLTRAQLPCADPGNWEVPSYVAADFATDFIHQRAKVAQAANKPFILEETGKAVRPLHMSFCAQQKCESGCWPSLSHMPQWQYCSNSLYLPCHVSLPALLCSLSANEACWKRAIYAKQRELILEI